MNLSLAEILLKQDGNSSLDRSREQHKHHGLMFTFTENKKQTQDLATQAGTLRASPSMRPINGTLERFGTFELWHRSARPLPLVGMGSEATQHFNLSLIRPVIVFTYDDKRLPLLPPTGITLLDCLSSLPRMNNFMRGYGIIPDMIRGKLNASYRSQDDWYVIKITIQPSLQNKVDEFCSNLIFSANYAGHVEFDDYSSGGVIQISGYHGHCEMPPGLVVSQENIYFWPRVRPLNEFGMLYVALYICGNYARYYPDFWIKDVDAYSPLALAVEELVHVAEQTMALLTLSELSRSYFVPEA
jgi:hypothetical protein